MSLSPPPPITASAPEASPTKDLLNPTNSNPDLTMHQKITPEDANKPYAIERRNDLVARLKGVAGDEKKYYELKKVLLDQLKQELLDDLNKFTGRSHTMQDRDVKRAINWCIELGLDFGGAYGRLRKLWVADVFKKAREKIDDDRNEMERLRSSAFFSDKYGNRTLKHPYAMEPRRIWDLYSHRVIPSYFVPDRKNVWAITHSHRRGKDKYRELSPVNEHQWKVALPNGVTLDGIRSDLLALGAEYCWLDVVCVRQRDDPKDLVVLDEEMAVDLPTMGNIYATASTVVRYYNGIGLPFNKDGLEDELHWLNRAWTLQEMNINTVIGGLKDGVSHVPITGYEFDMGPENYPEFSKLLRPLEDIITCTPRLAKIVQAMKPRYSQDKVDKIYGLGYLIKSRTLPAYHRVPNDDLREVEGTWWQLVYCMSNTMRGELLFLFPQPGDSGENFWMPTWDQLMKIEMVQDPHIDESVTIIAGRKAKYDGYLLANCEITDKRVTVTGGKERVFEFHASGTDLSNGAYTLVGNPRRNKFVVCKLQRGAGHELEKVAVIKLTQTETDKVLEWGLPRSICIFK